MAIYFEVEEKTLSFSYCTNICFSHFIDLSVDAQDDGRSSKCAIDIRTSNRIFHRIYFLSFYYLNLVRILSAVAHE